MDDIIVRLIEKYKWLILYGLFGIGTVAINMLVYGVCAMLLHWSTLFSNMLAWVMSVIFAYFTNRTWVFENSQQELGGIVKECLSFMSCRLCTGLLDILLMIGLVDIIKIHDIEAKVIVNLIIIVINLFLCRRIFKVDEGQDVINEFE